MHFEQLMSLVNLCKLVLQSPHAAKPTTTKMDHVSRYRTHSTDILAAMRSCNRANLRAHNCGAQKC